MAGAKGTNGGSPGQQRVVPGRPLVGSEGIQWVGRRSSIVGAPETNGWCLGNQWQGSRPSMVGTEDSIRWGPGKKCVRNRKLVAWDRGNGLWGPGHQWLWDREQKAEVQENQCLWPKEAMVGVHENNGWCPGKQMFFLMIVTFWVQEKKTAVQKHNDYVTVNQSLYAWKQNGANEDINAAVRTHQCLGSNTPIAGVHENMAV